MSKKKSTKSKSTSTKESDEDIYSYLKKKNTGTFGGGTQFWKPQNGRNVIRLLPFKHDGVSDVDLVQRVHWNVDPSKKYSKVSCLGKDNCPICRLQEEISAKKWSKVKPQQSVLVNALVREDPSGTKDKLVVAQLSVTAFFGYHSKEEDAETVLGIRDYIIGDDAVKDSLHETRGRDFVIERSGTGLRTRYRVKVAQKPSPVGKFSGKVVDLIEKFPPDTEAEVEEAAERIRRMK